MFVCYLGIHTLFLNICLITLNNTIICQCHSLLKFTLDLFWWKLPKLLSNNMIIWQSSQESNFILICYQTSFTHRSLLLTFLWKLPKLLDLNILSVTHQPRRLFYSNRPSKILHILKFILDLFLMKASKAFGQ